VNPPAPELDLGWLDCLGGGWPGKAGEGDSMFLLLRESVRGGGWPEKEGKEVFASITDRLC